MFKTTLLLAAVAVCAFARPPMPPFRLSDGGNHWAVLVAGSNTWGNYRHQADLCHAYQVLVSHGFDPDRIITFMYDDIANNQENPTPGKIINRPNGPDVYGGIRKDYTGADVTPQNFLNVIKGDKQAMSGIGSGRVLQSTSADNVFINFVDHGGPGIIAFPTQLLQASDLNSALNYMHQNNMYKQLVFYMEACESGSMFDNILSPNIAIYATTAADPTHSSYACYYDSERRTYLGDVYSVNWMENSDTANFQSETLSQQYQLVKQETNTSTVCQYGDSSFSSEPIGDFQGGNNSTKALRVALPGAWKRTPITDAVSSRDVELGILRHRLADAKTDQERTMLQNEMTREISIRNEVLATFQRVVAAAVGTEQANYHMSRRLKLTQRDCLETATQTFHKRCFNLAKHHYGLEHTMAFVSMCEDGISKDVIVGAIDKICGNKDNGFVDGMW